MTTDSTKFYQIYYLFQTLSDTHAETELYKTGNGRTQRRFHFRANGNPFLESRPHRRANLTNDKLSFY